MKHSWAYEQTRAWRSSSDIRRQGLPLQHAAVILLCAIGASVWVWRIGNALAPPPTLYHSAMTLPAPQPLPIERLAIAPALTPAVTPPLANRPLVQIPPPRPSVWQIRAELKQGLGEWYPSPVTDYPILPLPNPSLEPIGVAPLAEAEWIE